jgi:hypothetical protein
LTTRTLAWAIVADMQLLNAHVTFREAVLDLAEEATPRNVRRYLAASLLLDRPAATPPKQNKKGSKKWSEREQRSQSRSSR